MAKIREKFKIARLPSCILFEKWAIYSLPRSCLPTQVLREGCFLSKFIHDLEKPWWKILRSSKELFRPQGNVCSISKKKKKKAKIWDYSIVPAINVVLPLFKTIKLGHTTVLFLQQTLQLKPFQKAKN